WGKGSLQELDHPRLLTPVTKQARTVQRVAEIPAAVGEAFALANTPHRGPVFLDVPMDELYGRAAVRVPDPGAAGRAATPSDLAQEGTDPDALADIARLLCEAERPVLVLGTDVWLAGAAEAAAALVEELGLPTITNGMGRGILPPGHPLLVNRARGTAFGRCDLAIVLGTPLDFRLGYGAFGGRDGAPPAKVVHLADHPDQLAAHVRLDGAAAGPLDAVVEGLAAAWAQQLRRPDWSQWCETLRGQAARAAAEDAALLASDADPIHPARIYG